MTKLYPLKFHPILKERVWGGEKIAKLLNKQTKKETPIGESWELSGVQDDISIVSNGFLEGNNINDLIETYLGDLVGDAIYERYGNEFPLLIKILDIEEPLSLQIHPDDTTAMERHNSYGKTECWYILDAEPTAKVYLGLNQELTPQEFYERCNSNTIEEALNVITPTKGDIIYIEPGTLHSATGGLLVAEVQQVSDVTYRVYDWGREHNPKKAREMHLDLAIDCINYNAIEPHSLIKKEGTCDTPYFKIEEININGKKRLESHLFKSFIIYFVVEREVIISGREAMETIKKGETALIPAYIGEYSITGSGKLLEITGKAKS
ncbi:MAG: class I mannose-6-phosphate isomerase [Bacteroidales bacterium]|nr:class I mannose-6-phosphate isomerase [Bacteroidales bacterium]